MRCSFITAVVGAGRAATASVCLWDGRGGGGTEINLHAELHVLFLRRHCISLGYSTYQRPYPGTPADYNSGFFGGSPEEDLNGFTLNYSYILYPRKAAAGKLRYPLSVGVLNGTYTEPGNFHPAGGFFGGNYGFDNIESPTISLLLRSGLEYTPTRFFGLEGGGYVTLGRMNGVGIYAGLMLGYVGSRVRRRHHVEGK